MSLWTRFVFSCINLSTSHEIFDIYPVNVQIIYFVDEEIANWVWFCIWFGRNTLPEFHRGPFFFLHPNTACLNTSYRRIMSNERMLPWAGRIELATCFFNLTIPTHDLFKCELYPFYAAQQFFLNWNSTSRRMLCCRMLAVPGEISVRICCRVYRLVGFKSIVRFPHSHRYCFFFSSSLKRVGKYLCALLIQEKTPFEYSNDKMFPRI